jgi:hypothetical protein
MSSVAALGAGVASAAVSLIFGDLATQIGTGLDAITLDASVKESFSTTSKVTEHPIESGGVIADNITDEPDELQIEGIISNTPIMLLASLRISSTYAEDEYSKLLDLKAAKKPISIYTSKQEHENYVITSIRRTREAKLGDSVEVSMTFRKIRLVESKLGVQRPEGVQKPPVNLGKAAKKVATPAQAQTMGAKYNIISKPPAGY